MRLDVATQVRQRTAHANEIIHHDIFCTGLDGTIKFGLSCQSRKTIGTGVGHDVDLNHAAIHLPPQTCSQRIGERLGNGIDATSLVSMGAHQDGLVSGKHRGERFNLRSVNRRAHQQVGGNGITGFCMGIERMLLDQRFLGMDQDIGKFAPRAARRLHRVDGSTALYRKEKQT